MKILSLFVLGFLTLASQAFAANSGAPAMDMENAQLSFKSIHVFVYEKAERKEKVTFKGTEYPIVQPTNVVLFKEVEASDSIHVTKENSTEAQKSMFRRAQEEYCNRNYDGFKVALVDSETQSLIPVTGLEEATRGQRKPDRILLKINADIGKVSVPRPVSINCKNPIK